MKSRLLLSVLMLGLILGVYGQKPTITLTFAADENGQHVPLNSILIKNLTREVDTTLYSPDTVLVIDYLVGINENLSIGSGGFYLSQNYPNPFGGETNIDVLLLETENVLFIVSDKLGRELLNKKFRLNQGKHSFTFYPGTESLYFLTARTDRHSQTIKMINTPAHSSSQANCILEYNGMKAGFEQYKSGNDKINFVFYLGDLLKFTAFTDIGERVITDSPTDDQSYVFYFAGVPCLDAPTVTDIDGNVYRTVLIGDQCWMAENLKVGTMINGDQEMTDNGTIEKYCYDNDTANCDIYGGLYQWDEMMNYSSSQGAQGICPDGWHVPSDFEWVILSNFASSQPEYLCNNNIANTAKALASTTDWNSHTTICAVGNDLSENNISGFSGLPGGTRETNSTFYGIGDQSRWWSSSERERPNFWNRALLYNTTAFFYRYDSHKSAGYSVRCVKDYPPPPTTYILNIEVEPFGAACVSGSGQYEVGEEFLVSATAIPGFDFVNWTDEDGGIVSELASFTYIMPAYDVTLTANVVGEQLEFNCGDPLIDTRDGQCYATVQIGVQCWMAENLNIGNRIDLGSNQFDNGLIEKYCYNNSETYCNIYGGLYQWNEMMNYTTGAGAQGICPEGWYLPSDTEWCILENEVDPTIPCSGTSWRGVDGGGKLKEAGTNHWSSPNTGATNSSGFTALPGGSRSETLLVWGLNLSGVWWSSSQYNTVASWQRSLSYEKAGIIRYPNAKSFGFSVRCIKADFNPPKLYNLNLEMKPTGIAAITGEGQYQTGEQVNVVAEADPGWEFVNWKEDDVIISTVASFIYIMPEQDVTLTANFIQTPGSFECGVGTIADVDGNIYYTVLIDSQCWLKENLQTTKYSSGTPIEYPGTDNNAWSNNTSGAYAWYNNDLSWKTKYGALYNWYAVNNSNGLCPEGWHVPSDAEWTVLVDYVIAQGYPNNNYNNPNGAGNALKSCRQVNSPAGGDCNTSEHPRWNLHTIHIGFDTLDFSALPGGRRLINGNPYSMGSVGYWWSSTELSNIDAWGRLIIHSYGSIERWNHFNKNSGYSVRCLQD